MILAVDIGNSSISCGIFTAFDPSSQKLPECRCHFKIASKHFSVDEYILQFLQFLSMHHISPAKAFSSYCQEKYFYDDAEILTACVIASVVPTLTDTIAKAAKILTGSQPLIIGSGVRTGFGIKIRNPEQLGADIVANTAGAMLYAKASFAVMDVGTATTITYVNSDKELLGTIIMPGLLVSLSALTDSAALLTTVPLEKPQQLLGKTTGEAIRSGVIGGHAMMIDGFIRNIREQYQKDDEKLDLIATGGLAEAILPCCRNKFQYIEDLTLLGAVSLSSRNAFPRKQL